MHEKMSGVGASASEAHLLQPSVSRLPHGCALPAPSNIYVKYTYRYLHTDSTHKQSFHIYWTEKVLRDATVSALCGGWLRGPRWCPPKLQPRLLSCCPPPWNASAGSLIRTGTAGGFQESTSRRNVRNVRGRHVDKPPYAVARSLISATSPWPPRESVKSSRLHVAWCQPVGT